MHHSLVLCLCFPPNCRCQILQKVCGHGHVTSRRSLDHPLGQRRALWAWVYQRLTGSPNRLNCWQRAAVPEVAALEVRRRLPGVRWVVLGQWDPWQGRWGRRWNLATPPQPQCPPHPPTHCQLRLRKHPPRALLIGLINLCACPPSWIVRPWRRSAQPRLRWPVLGSAPQFNKGQLKLRGLGR